MGNLVNLRCFDTAFQRPYRYFSIALKVILSLSDRYKIFTNDLTIDWIRQNVGFSKIDITISDNNKQKTVKLINAQLCAI